MASETFIGFALEQKAMEIGVSAGPFSGLNESGGVAQGLPSLGDGLAMAGRWVQTLDFADGDKMDLRYLEAPMYVPMMENADIFVAKFTP